MRRTDGRILAGPAQVAREAGLGEGREGGGGGKGLAVPLGPFDQVAARPV